MQDTIEMPDTVQLIDSEAARLASAPGPPAPGGGWSDWLGMAASIGCAVHCAAMPFVIAYLPALGLSFLADEAFHKWMAVACFLIALAAFVPGLRKHRRLTPVVVASVGLVMISVAAFGFAGECCPSCATAAAPDASADSTAVVSLVALENLGGSEQPGACTDAGCPHCASSNPPASATVSAVTSAGPAVSSSSPWVGRIVPWLTPLGGIVLVSAHLLNRRYGCLCGCCGSGPVGEANG